eukprot:13858436-Alexandrium_andersonii.AAC.1
MHTAAESSDNTSETPLGPPSRWAPRRGPAHGVGRAASSRGDPPSLARRQRLRQGRAPDGQ